MDLFAARSLPLLTRRNYVYELLHIAPWSLLAGIIEGAFGAIVVKRTFHGSDLLTAVATATPLASLTFSMYWGLLCRNRPKIRLYTLLCTGTVLAAGPIGLIPVSSWGAVWFVAQMAAAQILLAGVVTVRSAMWKSNYPRIERGRITARLQAVRELGLVVAALTAAVLCDRDPHAYTYVYPAAALFGLVSILALVRIHMRGEKSELRQLASPRRASADPVPRPSAGALLSPWYILRSGAGVLRRDRRFATYVVAQLFVGLANQLTLAVIVVLISTDLTESAGLSGGSAYWFSTALIVALPKLFLLGTIGRWGRLFDRVGVIRFRVVNVMCWLLSLLFELGGALVVLGAESIGPSSIAIATALFAVRGAFNGLGMAGGRLAWNIGHLHFAEGDDAEVYMGIHVSLTGLRGVVAPIAGMYLWKAGGWWMWTVSIVLSVLSLLIFQSMARREEAERSL